MGLLIRTVFIWLLLLAVPAQGAAAATMAFCGPSHPGGAPADHQHPQAVALADEDSVASADSAASATGSYAGQQECSACAYCCSLGAVLTSVLAVPAPVFSPTVFSTMVASVQRFAAEGPDRPPRIVLV